MATAIQFCLAEHASRLVAMNLWPVYDPRSRIVRWERVVDGEDVHGSIEDDPKHHQFSWKFDSTGALVASLIIFPSRMSFAWRNSDGIWQKLHCFGGTWTEVAVHPLEPVMDEDLFHETDCVLVGHDFTSEHGDWEAIANDAYQSCLLRLP